MWKAIGVLIGALWGSEPEVMATIRADQFEGWYHSAVAGRLDIPDAVRSKGRSFQYVFVAGFRNERMPGYFAQNLAELRALGVPRRMLHVIEPSSSRSSAANADDLRRELAEIADSGGEKLVIVAHSRGACDALAFALENPEFVRNHVEALFLVQGPFGGSVAADYVVGTGPVMDHRMKWMHRVLGSLAGRIVKTATRKAGRDALEGMTRETSRAFWTKLLERNAEAIATVSSRVFFIRSAIKPSKLHLFRRAVAWYVQINQGAGDGVVAVEDQSLPGIGTVIATVEAGHADLTERMPATRSSRSLRKALSRSLLMAVGQPVPKATRCPSTAQPAIEAASTTVW